MRYIILALFLAACGKSNVDSCGGAPLVNRNVPGVLVIGDSISIGYTPYLTAAIETAEVTHVECNGQSSSNGVHRIDQWLAYRPHWKLITINHGYWDIPPNAQATTPAQYAANLEIEVTKAVAVSDQVVFINTTSVIPEWTMMTGVSNATVQQYNDAASQVMTALGVPIIDLYTVSLGIPERDPSVLHFLQPGYQALASSILSSVQIYLTSQ